MNRSLPTAYFDDLYADNPDPWRFATSDYERDKYAATLAALMHPKYRSALEVGCSIGILTQRLAPRCDRLLAIDAAAAPLEQARRRNAAFPWVETRVARVPEEWPEGESFDLILLSEILYYFDPDDLARLAARTLQSLERGGTVVLVHWLPETSYPMTGDEATEQFVALCGPALERRHAIREELYRLDVLSRP